MSPLAPRFPPSLARFGASLSGRARRLRCPAALPLRPRGTCRAGVLPVSPLRSGAVCARGVAALLPARPANRPPAGGVGGWRSFPPEPAPAPPSFPPVPVPRGSGQGPAGPPGSCQGCSLSHGLTTLLQTPPWAWLPPARPAPLPRSVWARREEGVTGQDEACTESSCR